MRVFTEGDELEVSVWDGSEEFLFAVGGFILVEAGVERDGFDLGWSPLFFYLNRIWFRSISSSSLGRSRPSVDCTLSFRSRIETSSGS